MVNIRYLRAEAGATGTLTKGFYDWSEGLSLRWLIKRLKIETQKTVKCGMPLRSFEYFFEVIRKKGSGSLFSFIQSLNSYKLKSV